MDENESVQKRALRLQKRIFKSLQKEVELLLGKTPASIRKYETLTRRDFRLAQKNFRSIEKIELIDSIRSSDVSLIADFHTFEQAQKTALRLAREAVRPDELWHFGLEMVPSQFQVALDRFQTGHLTTEEFHQEISYSQEWGFPWKHYAPLFQWARQAEVRLIALDRPKILKGQDLPENDLEQRDLWAAGVITDLFHDAWRKNLNLRMIVLFGELHLGSPHLPRQIRMLSKSFLKRELTTSIIHQNQDQLYWKLAEQGETLTPTITQLKKNSYCVFSSTPWNKLQSLVNWAEGGNDSWAHEELDDLALISNYGQSLSDFLNLPASHYESLSTCRIEQGGFLENLQKHPKLSRAKVQLLKGLIQQNQSFYLEDLNLAFLGTSSGNGLAEIAAIHLLHSQSNLFQAKKPTPLKKSDFFYRCLLEGTFGFFGSLILNPKRKCDLIIDHAERIKLLHSGTPPSFKHELSARSLALQFLELQKYFRSIGKHKLISVHLATRYIGQIYGKTLYQKLSEEKISVNWIRAAFELDIKSQHQENPPHLPEAFDLIAKKLGPLDWSASKNDSL